MAINDVGGAFNDVGGALMLHDIEIFVYYTICDYMCIFVVGTFNLMKNLYGVGELKNLTFPAASDLLESHAASAGGGTKRSPKILSKFKTSSVSQFTSCY